MANEEHLEILMQGVGVWNQWRHEHPEIVPDLSEADLIGMDLSYANFTKVNLSGADFSESYLSLANFIKANLNAVVFAKADLSFADLSGADLSQAYLYRATLHRAILKEARLHETILRGANLSYTQFDGANLSGADLSQAILIGAELTNTTLKDCRVYDLSFWDVQLDGTEQLDLIIMPPNQPKVTVDNLKVAQFLYLLLNNAEIRHVIGTITSNVVLMLGRFPPERQAVLDALREELRRRDYLPVLLDFEYSNRRYLPETISTLARLARFIIAALTEPNSIPHEVATIIPQCKVPVQPLLVQGDEIHEYPMFRDLRMYPWVLPTARYEDTPGLLAALQEQVIEPAERKAKELASLKAEA